jgi:fatty-acyl-CoA synthase
MEEKVLVGQILTESARRWPERCALVDERDRRWTYAAWNSRVNQLAHALARLGIGHGDRVAFYLRNVEALATAHLATQKLGAVSVPLNFRLREGEIPLIVEDSRARVLLFERQLSSRIDRARPALGGVEQFICVDAGTRDDALDYETLLGEAPADEPRTTVHPDDLGVLMYTSGTTGRPKGVMITHRHQWLNTVLVGWETGITADDSTLHVAPLYHSAAYHNFFLPHLMVGGCNVLMPVLDPERIAATLRRERITLLFGVPTIYALLADSSPSLWDRAVGATLRLCVSSSAAIRPETVEWIREQLCQTYSNVYGLTETSGNVTVLEPSQVHRFGAVNCIGRSLIGMETRVVRASPDQDVLPEDEVGEGEVGQLIVRGPKVMLGYLNRPEQTAAKLRHGWLYPGDLVYRDADHYLYILDRLDDAISVGAEMVYPKEVERVLDLHPGVKQSAVIGMPDPTWGQVVKAFVVPRGADLSPQEVRDFCRQSGQLASFKVPREVQVVAEIPTNPSGKVLKRELRELAS